MNFRYVIHYTPIFPESLSLTIFSSQVHVSFLKLCFIFLYVLIWSYHFLFIFFPPNYLTYPCCFIFCYNLLFLKLCVTCKYVFFICHVKNNVISSLHMCSWSITIVIVRGDPVTVIEGFHDLACSCSFIEVRVGPGSIQEHELAFWSPSPVVGCRGEGLGPASSQRCAKLSWLPVAGLALSEE